MFGFIDYNIASLQPPTPAPIWSPFESHWSDIMSIYLLQDWFSISNSCFYCGEEQSSPTHSLTLSLSAVHCVSSPATRHYGADLLPADAHPPHAVSADSAAVNLCRQSTVAKASSSR